MKLSELCKMSSLKNLMMWMWHILVHVLIHYQISTLIWILRWLFIQKLKKILANYSDEYLDMSNNMPMDILKQFMEVEFRYLNSNGETFQLTFLAIISQGFTTVDSLQHIFHMIKELTFWSKLSKQFLKNCKCLTELKDFWLLTL